MKEEKQTLRMESFFKQGDEGKPLFEVALMLRQKMRRGAACGVGECSEGVRQTGSCVPSNEAKRGLAHSRAQ